MIKGNTHIGQSDLLSAYNSACFNSFISNNDNEGFFFDYKNIVITSEKRINLFENKNLFENSRFILGHQRITTSGSGINYAQPFKSGNFVFFHNGIISHYDKNGHSDTYNLFNAFLKHYTRYSKKFKGSTSIKKAIDKALKNKAGSYSIGIYDIKNEELYYFKNDNTSIYALMDKKKEMFYLTTSYKNVDFLEIANEDFKEFEIEDYTLYSIKINKNSKISIKERGVLSLAPQPARTSADTSTKETLIYNQSYNKNLNDFSRLGNYNLLNLTFFKDETRILRGSTLNKCELCGSYTHNTKGDYTGIYCDSCLIQMENLNEE